VRIESLKYLFGENQNVFRKVKYNADSVKKDEEVPSQNLTNFGDKKNNAHDNNRIKASC
jgi:hypothetical protein